MLYKLGEIPYTWPGSPGHSWRPGHVVIYVEEKINNGEPFNVIEVRREGVARNYYNPIYEFSGNDVYMWAREPLSESLNEEQRRTIVDFAESKAEAETPYAKGKTVGIIFGLLRGDSVKSGNMNCVGLAEAAYEMV